ncbi:hypothetical protein VNO77_14864 [Canavalia gladiata]|uniref:Uncharacterized protein n=1 Tax=Canavalia gladiata TaxID=3824 RepID=A0AAN9LYI3_CANGL
MARGVFHLSGIRGVAPLASGTFHSLWSSSNVRCLPKPFKSRRGLVNTTSTGSLGIYCSRSSFPPLREGCFGDCLGRTWFLSGAPSGSRPEAVNSWDEKPELGARPIGPSSRGRAASKCASCMGSSLGPKKTPLLWEFWNYLRMTP